MDLYKHGVYPAEHSTSMAAPIRGTAGLQVVFGTAPVNMLEDPAKAVNRPILVGSYTEAVKAVGYSADFDSYTLCDSIAASFQVVGVAPMVLVNVLDPEKHKAVLEETDLAVTGGKAVLDKTGVLPKSLAVKADGTALAAGSDYTTAFNPDGTLTITLAPGGKGAAAEALTVSGEMLDPSKVTAADIVGGVDAQTGKESGLEVLRQVYPLLSLVPGLLIAPRWSRDPAVAAAMQAKTRELNGTFKLCCIVDVDSTADGAVKYTDVKEQKEAQAVADANAYPVWLYAKSGSGLHSGSAMAAALTVYTDAQNDDTPNVSPSNKAIGITAACLADGTEVLLDQAQANIVNSYGVATWLNMGGFRLWGNNTAAYPGTTDPKDRWFSVRRFLNWAANTFILTYFEKVDNPANKRMIEAIVDSENVRGNGFVARGVCARYETVYLEADNSAEDLMGGKLTFRQYITPFTPAECIEDIIEFDPNALTGIIS